MTGRIFAKLIAGVFLLLGFALITVDYSATRVAESSYIRNLERQLAQKGRMLVLSTPDPLSTDVNQARKMAHAAGGRLPRGRRSEAGQGLRRIGLGRRHETGRQCARHGDERGSASCASTHACTKGPGRGMYR